MPKFDRYWNPKDTVRVQSDKFRNRLERYYGREGVQKWDEYFQQNPNTAPWKETHNNPYAFARGLINGQQNHQQFQPQLQPQTYTLQSDYWLNPKNIGLWYDKITAGTSPLPDWMDENTKSSIKNLYKYLDMQNNGKPYSEWKPLSNNDPAIALISKMAFPQSQSQSAASIEDVKAGKANWTDLSPDLRQKILADPNFYKSGISQFDINVRNQIRSDPNFQWGNLPTWQKILYDLQSSPATMGAVQGGLMGAGGGLISGSVGAAIGAGIGWAANASGYDPTKEFWQQGQYYDPEKYKGTNVLRGTYGQPMVIQNGKVDRPGDLSAVARRTFGLLNFLTEQVEKTIGLGVQAIGAIQDPNVSLKDVFSAEGWNAGAVTFETLGPAINAAATEDLPRLLKGNVEATDILKLSPPIWVAERLTSLMLNPDRYKGDELIIGQSMPEELTQNFQQRINEARQRIKNGENYRQVALDFQAGVIGQMSDMFGQSIADPLNYTGAVGSKIISKFGELESNHYVKLAEKFKAEGDLERADAYALKAKQAQRVAQAFEGSHQISEGKDKLKAIIQATPVNELSDYEKFLGGITEEGKIAKLEKPATSGIERVREFFTMLTPKRRAITALNMAVENLGAYLNMFDNVDELSAHFKQLQGTDNRVAAEFGARMLNSPEWYTIFPAMKNYDLGIDVARWEAVQPNINILNKLAEVLGEKPERVIKDLSDATDVKRNYQRIIEKAGQMTGNAATDLLEAAKAGRFTPDDLSSIVKVFHENGAPYTFDMWKAQTIANMGKHFADWAVKFYDVKPNNNFWVGKVAPLLKKAQSLALLGLNPGNFIQNEIGNIMGRVAAGNYGYVSPAAAAEWLDRFGFKPARYGEGVGFTGEAVGKGEIPGMDVIAKASEQRGIWKAVSDVISGVNKIGIFGKLNEFVESVESQNAYVISMKRMMNEIWKPGKGFRLVDPELRQRLTAAGFDEKTLYHFIESGLNMNEIENAVYRQEQIGHGRAVLEEAARRLGTNADEAIRTFSELGILDELDKRLKTAKTAEQRMRVFNDVVQRAQDMMDVRNATDIAKRIEHVKNKVTIEGGLGIVNILEEIEGGYFDRWLNHYLGYGDLWDTVYEAPPELRDTLIMDYERQNRASWNRTNSYQLANYKALFDGLGVNHPMAQDFMAALSEYQRAYGDAYRARFDERLQLHDKWAGKMNDPAFWDDVQASNDRVQKVFEQAHRQAQAHMETMQKSIAKLMGDIYGERVGLVTDEVFSQWRQFREKMIEKINEHRASIKGMDGAQRRLANEKFYQQDYPLMIEQFRELKRLGVWTVWDAVNGGSTEDINGMLAAAQQRNAMEAAARQEHVQRVWDVAGRYLRDNAPYNPADTYALLGALKMKEYGGIPDLKGLGDPRITPEFVRSVLENRMNIKTLAEEAGFDLAAWEKKFKKAVKEKNPDALYALADKIPDSVANAVVGNETYGSYINRTIGEVAAEAEKNAKSGKIANGLAEQSAAQAQAQAKAERVITRESTGTESADAEIEATKQAEANFRRQVEEKLNSFDRLFQNADTRVPPNGYDELSGGFLPESRVLDEGWTNYVWPLLNEMKKVAGEGVTRTLNISGLDAETQAMLRRYLNQVRGDLATSKLITTRFAEMQRDLAMLNYNNRTPFGEWVDTVFPYRFWGTETMKNWFLNAPDRIGWFAHYARIQQMMNKYQRDWPERLRGRIKLPAPFLPDWMGDNVYVDPVRQIFQFSNFLSPFETMASDKRNQLIEAERILQEWAKDGTYTQDEIQQALSGQGPVYEKALAEAKLRRTEQITGPAEFMNMMFGIGFYLTTPYYLATGQGEKISETPMLKSTRAFEAALKGSPFEALGNVIGLLGKPEEWLRSKAGLPEFGEYGDYYINRQLANMVADGTEIDGKPVSPEMANKAMIEKQGPLYELARERVKQELMLRVPGMSALYAGTHGASLEEMLLAVPESLFGAQLLPEGELRYRGLKEKWNAAWKAYDNGDKKAVQRFFDDHPEYESYLMKGKSPEEMLRAFLVGQIWNRYMGLDKGNQKIIRAQMGDLFQRAFLDKNTRSAESIDVNTLAVWSRMLGGMVPQTEATRGVTEIPQAMMPRLEGMPPKISQQLNTYYQERDRRYPNIMEIQNMYYAMPKEKQYQFKQMYPELSDYWAWRRSYIQSHPEAAPFIDGKIAENILQGKMDVPPDMNAEQYKRLLTYYRGGDEGSQPTYTAEFYLKDATPTLRMQLDLYRMTGQPLGAGALHELAAIWEANGKPTNTLQEFVDQVIVPTLP